MIKPKSPPYANTKVDPEKTKGQISKLFHDFGITKYRWTEDYEKNEIMVEFLADTSTIDGKPHQLLIRCRPSPFMHSHKSWNAKIGKNEIIQAPNWAVSFRTLLNWLKAKLIAVAYGQVTIEEEFLPQIVTLDGNTISQKIFEGIKSGSILLEDKAEQANPQITDAEYSEVGQ